MSLINDALKRARQAQAGEVQNPLPPLPPTAGQPVSPGMWLLPAIVIFLVVAAIFFIGLAMARHSVHNTMAVPPAPVIAVTQPAPAVAPPVAVQTPAPSPAAPTVVVNSPKPPPPASPRLQGIFYSRSAPAAILDGKMVRPGDSFLQYRVTEITRSTVTLAAPGGKAVKLGLDN